MAENKPSLQKKLLYLVIVLFALATALNVAGYLSSRKNYPPIAVSPTPTIVPTLSVEPTVTPTPTIVPISDNINDWQEYNSNLASIYLNRNLEAPFLFKYPKEWRLSEGMGGISIYSFDDHIGYDVGTVPAGKFMINIAPDIKDKNNEEIKTWCSKNLYTDGSGEILSEKYLEVDGNEAYSADYKMGFGNFDLIRQVCIAKSGLKIMIFAEPLDSNYLGIFDKILSTFKFIK